MPNLSLYDDVIRLGIPHDSHESDLYLPSTPEVWALLKAHNKTSMVTTFKSQIDGQYWVDVPFMYQPFWERVSRKSDAKR